MADEGEKAVVGTAPKMPSNRGLTPAEKAGRTRAEKAARRRAEKAGVDIPAAYRRKKGEVLNRRSVKVLPDGMYQDAATPHLYLSVKKNGRYRSYLFRYKKRTSGKDTHLGLGSVNAVDLERARQVARSYNELLARGDDPEDVRGRERLGKDKAMTINRVADEYYRVKLSRKSANYQKLCRGTIDNYIRPAIGDVPIANVTRDMIMKGPGDEPAGKLGLEQLWETKNQTAVQVRMHLLRIFDWAEEEGYIQNSNITARWMKHRLPTRGDVHKVEHHAESSVPIADIYRFLERVRSCRGGNPSTAKYRPNRYRVASLMSRKALWIELVALTGACRISEWSHAQWKEFNFETMTWIVPWEHLKTGRAHRRDLQRPINKEMRAALDEARRITQDHSPEALVLPGTGGRPMGSSHLQTFLDRVVKWETKVKSHAFRGMQRDWMRYRGYDDTLWKIQADHNLGPAADRAYGLDGQLEPRREIMAEWGDVCTTPPPEPQEVLIDFAERKKRQCA